MNGRRTNRLARVIVSATLPILLIGPLTSCGRGDGTTTLEPSTTETSAPSGTQSKAPSKEALEAAVATFTKLGFKEDQARCLVEHMSEFSGDVDAKKVAEDQSAIDKLMADCGISTEQQKQSTPGN